MSGVFKGIGLAQFNAERAARAGTKACAQAVAQLVGNQPQFAVFNAQRAFGAGGQAHATTVAQFFIYFNDSSIL